MADESIKVKLRILVKLNIHSMELVSDQVVEHFRANGFAVIPGFLSSSEVTELKEATKEIVTKYCQDSPISIFRHQSRDTYFAESGDKIRGFYEEGFIPKDSSTAENAAEGLNKVGHALHTFHPTFRRISFGQKVRNVLSRLTTMKDPLINQSMVIFKHPKVGGIVNPHQDATYLFTDPTSGALLGFWIALDEASTTNGCLHFFPGSHKEGKVYQRFVRNPDKGSETLFIQTGVPIPKLSNDNATPANCKPGDLVLIDGLVIHQSEPNTSDKPRMAYTFHVIDGAVKYSTENWLQPTSMNTFEKFKNVNVPE